jgi:hypothetical protein
MQLMNNGEFSHESLFQQGGRQLVYAEIMLAKKSNKIIAYFAIENPHRIVPIIENAVEMESEVATFKPLLSQVSESVL